MAGSGKIVEFFKTLKAMFIGMISCSSAGQANAAPSDEAVANIHRPLSTEEKEELHQFANQVSEDYQAHLRYLADR
jgi:hypothetical protein